MAKIAQIDRGSLKRTLGVADLFALGYGDLGSSIYYALGITAFYALGATPLALACAGAVFSCTALTYAEMTSISRDPGGSAFFTRMAFNDLISFIAGWGLLLDYIVTIAISSYAVAPYLSYFFGPLKETEAKIVFTLCVILVLFIINLFGTKHSTRISWILTLLTVATQIVIIAIGAYFLLNLPEVAEHLKINIKGSLWSPTWPDFWKGVAMAMVAYTGIESMTQLTREAKTPSKTVPRAILLAMSILLLMYFGVSTVALSAMTPQELSTTYLDDPISGIVAALPFGGSFLGGWVGILAAIILFVAANAGLIGASRLCFNMSEYYQIPRVMYRLHPRYKTPYVSLATFGGLAAIIVIWSGGKLAFLADLYNFGAMLAFTSAHLSLLMLRIKKPNIKRPFKVPLNIRFGQYQIPIPTVLGGLATFSTWILVIITKPDGRYLGFAWLALGLAMYYFYRKKHKIGPTSQVEIKKVRIPEFKKEAYSHILVPTRGGSKTDTIQLACEIARIHKADVTALHIIDVPFSLPLGDPDEQRTVEGDIILQQAEAVGREFNIPMNLKIVYARGVDRAILELVETGKYDLLVMGGHIGITGQTHGLGTVTEEILRESKIPVWVSFGRGASIQTVSRT